MCVEEESAIEMVQQDQERKNGRACLLGWQARGPAMKQLPSLPLLLLLSVLLMKLRVQNTVACLAKARRRRSCSKQGMRFVAVWN